MGLCGPFVDPTLPTKSTYYLLRVLSYYGGVKYSLHVITVTSWLPDTDTVLCCLSYVSSSSMGFTILYKATATILMLDKTS